MADIANKTESWSGHTLGEVESHIKSRLNTDESIVGFYTCGTVAATAAKVVAASNYVLTDGGSIKIKFTYANSVASPTLNINSTGAKAIVYNGAVASATNTWETGDVVEFYYDPTYNSNVGAYIGIPTVVATPAEVSQLGQQVIYDVTANNGGATFASLSALLSSENLSTLIPIAVRCGGMSIRFVQSSDNQYVQYRLMADDWSVYVRDWSVCDENFYINNEDYIEVKTDSEGKILWAIKKDGTVFFGAGVPQQVVDLLSGKVDKVEGKELSSNDYTDEDKEIVETLEFVENSTFIEITTDKDGKVLCGRKRNGVLVEYNDVEYPNGIPTVLQGQQMYNHHDSFNDKSLWWVLTDYLESKYWPLEQTTVESFIAKFRARAGANVYQIAVISDTHGSGNYTKGSINATTFNSNMRSIATFNKLIQYCNAGIHGGDISCDHGTSRLRILQYMYDVMKYFIISGSKPLFITKGNHDENNNEYVEADQLHLDWNNTYYSAKGETTYTNESQWNGNFLYVNKLELVSDKEFKNMAQHYNSPVGAVWGNGAYYYYDIESAKLRVIVGNSFPIKDDYTDGSADEYLWLAQSAFNFSDKNNPQEWQTLMLRHTQATSITNLANCINAFVNGSTWTYGETTIDFGDINGGGMTFIAHIHGHEHHYCFSNGAGFFDIGETISCTDNLGTATDYGLSVWSIDLANKKVHEDTIDGKTWIYNYESGRLELKRGDSFTVAKSGLGGTVTAACTEPTITCSNQTVTIGNDTSYGNYTVQAVSSNGNFFNYLISVVE